MATQKELDATRATAVKGVKAGVDKTSGSRLLDLLAALQEMFGTDAVKEKKPK